ncbi:hypothetical protein RB195_020573 [Necator americanus]|uniref:G-protein coupled receptors family 1 profile domain-containing protein n=1 Tax=Necator americanus TaxID=51031 RepID=A0ABR1CLJ9_NECAM
MEWLIRNGGNAENMPGYDCKLSDRKPGKSNSAIGWTFITYGVVAEIIYALDMIVMMRKRHRTLSCYKIMLCLGFFDMAAIVVNSLITGYLWLKGSNYCTNPTFIFVAGTAGTAIGSLAKSKPLPRFTTVLTKCRRITPLTILTGRRTVVKGELTIAGLLSIAKSPSATPAYSLLEYPAHWAPSPQTLDNMVSGEGRSNVRLVSTSSTLDQHDTCTTRMETQTLY